MWGGGRLQLSGLPPLGPTDFDCLRQGEPDDTGRVPGIDWWHSSVVCPASTCDIRRVLLKSADDDVGPESTGDS